MGREEDLSQAPTLAGEAPTAARPHDPEATLDSGVRAADLGLPEVAAETYARGGEVARGGMGRIVAARDRRLGRAVALKEVLPGQRNVARFEREALLTARLQHPSIVTVYEAGRWPGGEPFYAMRFVEGRPLDELIAATTSLAERLRLLPHVIAMVEALAYAHAQGVIHRDLKPANVLVGPFGETVVVDWGLAKDLRAAADPAAEAEGAPAGGDAGLTAVGSVMGTPAYMPPEQARGQEVDARADVYALGAILYHLLSGARPYGGASSLDVLKSVIAGPPRPLEEREPGVPRDLAAIVRQAMAARAGDRYASAAELAADLKRFQTGQLVAAHRYSRGERALRFVKKHRAVLSLGTAALLALAVVGGVSVQRIRRERNQAEAARAEAERRRDALVLTQARTLMASDPTAALALLKTYPLAGQEPARAATIAAEARSLGVARILQRAADDAVIALRFVPGRPLLAAVGWSARGLALLDTEGGRLERLADPRPCERRSWARMSLSADGRTAVVGGCDATLAVYDLDARTARTLPVAGLGYPLAGVALAPDGTKLAVSGAGGVQVLDPHTGQALQTVWANPAGRFNLTWSPHGRWLAGAGPNLSVPVHLWEVEGGRHVELAPGGVAAFSPDEQRLAYADGATLRLRELESGRETAWTGHGEPITAAAFSPDGRQLATASKDWTVRLWDLAGGASRVVRGHQGPVEGLLFSPDGSLLASSDESDLILLLSLADGRARTVRRGRALAFSPDSRLLAAGSVEGQVRVWSARPEDGRVLASHQGTVRALALSPDGRLLASGGRDRLVRLHDLESGETRVLAGHAEVPFYLKFNGRGDRLFSSAGGQEIYSWDVASGKGERVPSPLPSSVAHDFSPNGVFSVVGGGRLVVWRPEEESRPLLDVPLPDGGDCVLSADARWLFTRSATLRLWEVASGRSRLLQGATGGVSAYEFSPDGRWLATGSLDGSVRLWPTAEGEPRLLGRHASQVRTLAFSDSGRELASGSGEGAVRVWDLASGVARPLQARSEPARLRFSPDGSRLAVVEHYSELFDLPSGEARPFGAPGEVIEVTFMRDGRGLVTGSASGAVQLWLDDVPAEPQAFQQWLQQATQASAEPGTR